jgi:hypothetical protein
MRVTRKAVLRAASVLVLVISIPAALAADNAPAGSRTRRLTTQSRIQPPSGDPTAGSRIQPPSGEPAPTSRIKPPSGDPSLFELLLEWVRAQARIGVPIG